MVGEFGRYASRRASLCAWGALCLLAASRDLAAQEASEIAAGAPFGVALAPREEGSRRSEALKAVSPAGRWCPLRSRRSAGANSREAGGGSSARAYLPEAPKALESLAVYTYQGSTAGLYVYPEEENPDFEFSDIAPPTPLMYMARLAEDFERYPEGASPIDAGFRVEGLGDSVRVEVEGGPGGDNRYLRIVDSPSLRFHQLPALWYGPNHRFGTTTFSFDLRIQAGTTLRHEWRERRRAPTRIGPSFEIQGCVLSVRGEALAVLPEDEWVHFRIEAPLGPGSGGSWKLRIELGDGTELGAAELEFEDADFASVTWIGFWTIGNSRAAWCLDNVSLGNSLEEGR